MRHALSFDVENWYDGTLFKEDYKGPADDRVVAETYRVLEVLNEAGVHATFFTVGRVAKRHPQLIRQIAGAGHEIACHSFDHDRVFPMTPKAFLDDLIRARTVLQDVTGQPVLGYRAPSWSIHDEALDWAPPLVAQAGFVYDSSVFPMKTPYYGVDKASTEPWYHQLPDGRSLLELPPAVARIGPWRVPYGGGIYWRLLPDWAIARLMNRATAPAVFYLHPWELNPVAVPRCVGVPWAKRPVLTVGIGGAERCLARMLKRFQFGPMACVFAELFPAEVREWVGSTGFYAATSSY